MATEKRVDNRVYFRKHDMPSKKTFKKLVLIETLADFEKTINQIGQFSDIDVCEYLLDKRKGYSREGVIYWMTTYAITGVDSEGQRQNIGYVNKIIPGMPYKRT